METTSTRGRGSLPPHTPQPLSYEEKLGRWKNRASLKGTWMRTCPCCKARVATTKAGGLIGPHDDFETQQPCDGFFTEALPETAR